LPSDRPPVVSLENLAKGLNYRARLLGIDLGTQTIGLAFASLEAGIATPLHTIRRTRFQEDARALMALAGQERIDAFVLGLPLNMDGSSGPRVQATRAFARSLNAFSPPPVLLFDERLSSSEAEDGLIETGLSVKRRARHIDAAAARIILQGAVNSLLDAMYMQDEAANDQSQE
jgi:putative holliday junction resolvase